MIKIYIENYGSIFGKNVPEALNKLDGVMREKFNDSVHGALARGNGNGNGHSPTHRRNRAYPGDVDPTYRRLFMRRRRG